MKTINFLIFATCLLVTLNSNVMAMKGEDPKAQSSDSHLAELKELDAWCPLDGKLTGLDLGYCNNEKISEDDKGPLLQASESRARKVLFGTEKKGQECGLCSASMGKKGCSTTKSGVKVSFDIAIKADNYQMLNKWCLLGRANMEVCRNFGSESEGMAARTQMCKDLKAKKFALDPLRALEFGAGEDEPLSDIVRKLGQNKVYSLLGLGGCLTLLEEKAELLPIFKKIRPDAAAVICVQALANPTTAILDVVSQVYEGFIKKGVDILSRHRKEFVKTNLPQVIKRINSMLTSLNRRQVNFTTVERTENKKVVRKTAELKNLTEIEAFQKAALANYTKRAEEYRKRYKKFQTLRGPRVVLPPTSSETQGQTQYVPENKTIVPKLDEPLNVTTHQINTTKLVKQIENQTTTGLSDEGKKLVQEEIKKHLEEMHAKMEAVKEEAHKKVAAAESQVGRMETEYKQEVSKVRDGSGFVNSDKLKSQ